MSKSTSAKSNLRKGGSHEPQPLPPSGSTSGSGSGSGASAGSSHHHHHPSDHGPHGYDHTPVHDYEANQTDLRRWLDHAMQTPWFWPAVALLVIGPLAWVLYTTSGASGNRGSAAAWRDLQLASTPEQWDVVIETYPDEPAAQWARLKLAEAKLNEGIATLTRNASEADPALEEAQTQYEAALEKAPAGSDMKRLATFGLARCNEVRNDLGEAIKLYKDVETNWAETFEGKKSKLLIARLESPDGQSFYQQLREYKPVPVPVPGAGLDPNLGKIPSDPGLPPVFTPEGPEAIDPLFPSIVPDNPFAAPLSDEDRDLVPNPTPVAPAPTP